MLSPYMLPLSSSSRMMGSGLALEAAKSEALNKSVMIVKPFL
jgi:hypothetical protein